MVQPTLSSRFQRGKNKAHKMSKGSPRELWISVEGIIGAGKSTLIEGLSTLNGRETTLVEEPVKEWINSGLLQKAYEKPVVYNFPAQCKFFTSRIQGFDKIYQNTPVDKRLFVSERCAFSDVLFWNTQLELDRLDDPMLHGIYKDMWSTFQRLQPMPNPTLFVYLRPTLDECMRRMQERGRKEELSVDIPYQEELYRQHDDKFMSGDTVEMPNGTRVPCIVIDSNVNFRDDPQELTKIVQKIEDCIYEQ